LLVSIVGLALGIWFTLRYAERVRRDPSNALMESRAYARSSMRRGV
jgi:uncharacterized ion transporter superfamily protein YfcC